MRSQRGSFGCLFYCRARAARCCIICAHRFDPALELAQPRPRQPARGRAAAATRALPSHRRVRTAGPARSRPVEERGHHVVRLHRQHRAGQDRLARADRRRPARRRIDPAVLDRRRLRPPARADGRPDHRGADSVRAASCARALADLVRGVPPGAFGIGPAASVRVRRRSRADRLRARDRRRRAARADRIARAAPARPRRRRPSSSSSSASRSISTVSRRARPSPSQGGATAASALVVLAASGAPSVAMLLAAAGAATALRSSGRRRACKRSSGSSSARSSALRPRPGSARGRTGSAGTTPRSRCSPWRARSAGSRGRHGCSRCGRSGSGGTGSRAGTSSFRSR